MSNLTQEQWDHVRQFDYVNAEIENESMRHLTKWGVQNHSPETWLMILTEEFGEFAKEVMEKNPEVARKELTQVAAVAHAMLHNNIFHINTEQQEANHGSNQEIKTDLPG